MKRRLVLLATVLAGLTLAASALEVKRLNRPFSLGGGKNLRLEIPEGIVDIYPHTGSAVDVDMKLECVGDLVACRPEAREVSLLGKRAGDTLTLSFSGPDELGEIKPFRWDGFSFRSRVSKATRKQAKARNSYKWRITVDLDVHGPASVPVELFLGRGQAIFHDLSANATVKIDEGHAQIRLAASKARSVQLQADRVALNGPRGVIDRGRKKLHWDEGPGEVDIVVEIGQGRAVVELY